MTETFEYTGSKETVDISDDDVAEVELHGAGGGDGGDNTADGTSGGSGGDGGHLTATIEIDQFDELDIFVGGSGERGSNDQPTGGDGGWGHFDGGDGGDATSDDSFFAGSGGGAGGQTAVVTPDGTVLASASGGGAGAGASDASGEDPVGAGGGGGGGGGGNGGSPTQGGNSGDSGEGSGDGGDGGSGGSFAGEDGEDGGFTTDGGFVTSSSGSTGGGNSGDGVVEFNSFNLIPKNLTAESDDEEQITLSWDEIDGVDSYNVYRSESSGSSLSDYTFVDDTISASFSDTDLTNGRQYFYRVTSVSDGNESDPSNEDNATTDLPTPTLDSLTSGDREVTVGWTLNDDNPDGSVDVDRGATGSGATISDLSTTSYTDTGADLDGEEYTYQIIRDTGDASGTSSSSTVVTNLPPATDLAVVSVSGRSATLSWTDPSNNANGYRLLLREDDDGGYSQDGADVDPVSEGSTASTETTELLDGQLYGATIETYTDYTTAREDQ